MADDRRRARTDQPINEHQEYSDDNQEEESLLKTRHKRMLLLASFADILFWVLLGVTVATAAGKIIEYNGPGLSHWDSSTSDPIFFYLGLIPVMLQTITFSFIAKAIAFAMRMLVEIDMNYALSRLDDGEPANG